MSTIFIAPMMRFLSAAPKMRSIAAQRNGGPTMKAFSPAPTVRSIAAQRNGGPTMKAISPAPTARSIAAQGNALGSGRPHGQALKGRPNGGTWRIGCTQSWAALSGLRAVSSHLPRALPWAAIGCPFGAEESKAARTCPDAALAAKVDQHLQKMGAVWK
jgi:hypothetical protein